MNEWVDKFFPSTVEYHLRNSVASMDTKKPSSSKNNNKSETDFVLKNEDLLHTILGKLPALSFASSACVCKTWHKVCNQILSRPKINSAFSLNSPPRIAVKEVVDKVLSGPIRPYFAIANVSRVFNLKQTTQWLAECLGSQTPIIVSCARGIMGRDAVSDQFREVKFVDDDDYAPTYEGNSGIVLTVGFVPGLKVDAIPLLGRKRASQVAMVDKFVMDIKNYTTSVSGSASPVGIIMFGNEDVDQKLVVEKLDYTMSMETVIVGDERSQFFYKSGNELRNVCQSPEYFPDAIALIFASDKDKLHEAGKIQFHLALSEGVSAVGPRHMAVSVRSVDSNCATWLTARREGDQEILDGQQMLDRISDELGNGIQWPELYIGVTKRRKCSMASGKTGLITSLAFYGVIEGDEEYLYADGLGIRSGDYFQFYRPDPAIALAACRNINIKLRNLKLDYDSKNCLHTGGIANNVGKEVFGGFIFSCCGRGDSFFEGCNVDSYTFMENFPDVPLAGIFCGGEIGRGSPSLLGQDSQEKGSVRLCLHVFSTVYLLMSYTPAGSEV